MWAITYSENVMTRYLAYRPYENFFGVEFIFCGTKLTKKCMKVIKTALKRRSQCKKDQNQPEEPKPEKM